MKADSFIGAFVGWTVVQAVVVILTNGHPMGIGLLIGGVGMLCSIALNDMLNEMDKEFEWK
jgi:hypothetical protein